jgi:hypothetical protein
VGKEEYVVSLSSGLLQFVSNTNLLTPTSKTVSGDNGLSLLNSMYATMQSSAKSQASTAAASSSSAQLAQDTYTSSNQLQTTQSTATTSNATSTTLADLIKNQTISGSSAVRQVLLAAIQSNSSGDPEATAWNTLTDEVNSGDYSGALTALADYSTALNNSHIGTWADLSTIKSAMTTLGSALQAGNTTDVQTAFTALTNIAPTHNLGLVVPTITGDIASEDTQLQWAAANMADSLQKLGYTATNAAAEANAWMLGYAADSATMHITTLGSPSDEISNHSDVDQSITDLAKAAASSTNSNLMTSILAGMSQANSVTAMESTLTQLDSKYGSGAQGAAAANASQASVSVYA